MKLVRDAIAAGIFNDLGSGSNVDMCVITKDKVDYIRPYEEANKKGVRSVQGMRLGGRCGGGKGWGGGGGGVVRSRE